MTATPSWLGVQARSGYPTAMCDVTRSWCSSWCCQTVSGAVSLARAGSKAGRGRLAMNARLAKKVAEISTQRTIKVTIMTYASAGLRPWIEAQISILKTLGFPAVFLSPANTILARAVSLWNRLGHTGQP